MKPNAELAYRVLDHIDAHPDSWDQGTWSCGTAACFAGWAIRLVGGRVVGSPGDWTVVGGPPEAAGRDVEMAALAVLGLRTAWLLREDERRRDDWLFAPANTREDLGRLVEELFGPRPGGEA